MKAHPFRPMMRCFALGLVLACAPEPTAPDERDALRPPALPQADRTFSEWTEPASLGPTINTTFSEQQAALSRDGLSLYFNSNRPTSPNDVVTDANIWVARRGCRDCPWETPVPLGPTINTPGNDANPSFSRDGHRLFFVSNRTDLPGAMGLNDLWVSYREHVHDDFAWETPVNLGPGMNTAGNEAAPAYVEHEELGAPELYLNRQTGPAQIFAGDIYVSTLGADGAWTTAVPVTELNSDAADQKVTVHPNGLELYFFSNRDGESHIYHARRASVRDAWSTPVLVGSPIGDIEVSMPFIHAHGNTELLFMTRSIAVPGSDPPATQFDLFVSERSRGSSK